MLTRLYLQISEMLRVTSDTSSDEENFNIMQSIGTKIRTFIRMKESDFVKNQLMSPQKKKIKICRNSYSNNEPISSREIEMDSSLDENEQSDILIKNNQNTWERYWSEIESLLKILKENDENHRCIEISTNILNLHVIHSLNLGLLILIFQIYFYLSKFIFIEPQTFDLLMHCLNPHLIVKVFEYNLIENEDLFHIGCLFESDQIFTAISEYSDNSATTNKHASKVILSISVMLYKWKCLNHLKAIKKSLSSIVAVFVNREDYDNTRTGKLDVDLKKAVKFLVLALIHNGIFDVMDLNEFLLIKDLETSISEDTNWSDSDSELEDLIRMRNIRQNKKTVGERLNINMEKLSKKIFPLSLQNLARIKIKNQMNDYSIAGVNQLKILPNVLKKFVIFDDEINSILNS